MGVIQGVDVMEGIYAIGGASVLLGECSHNIMRRQFSHHLDSQP